MSRPRIAATSGARAGRGLETVTRWVLAHKGPVAAFWIVLTLVGFQGASKVVDRLDAQFSMPSSDAYAVNEEIKQRFDSGGEATPLVAVATLPEGASAREPGVREDLRRLERRLAAAVPGSRIASYGSTGEPAYVSDDGRTTFVIAYPPIEEGDGPGAETSHETLEAARGAVADAEVGGSAVLLTGRAALQDEPAAEAGEPSFLSETLLAGVAALVVLVFVFASALAVVPLLMAVVAIPVTLLAVLGLTTVTDVSFIVLFLCSLVGLGLAIDYALIVVMRWREERERGLSNEEAVLAAARTASTVSRPALEEVSVLGKTSTSERPPSLQAGADGALVARTPSTAASSRAAPAAPSLGAIASIGVSGPPPMPERSSATSPAWASPLPPSDFASGSPRSMPDATPTKPSSRARLRQTASTRWRMTRRAQAAQCPSARSVRRSRRRSARGPNLASTIGSRVSATATETSGIRSPP